MLLLLLLLQAPRGSFWRFPVPHYFLRGLTLTLGPAVGRVKGRIAGAKKGTKKAKYIGHVVVAF